MVNKGLTTEAKLKHFTESNGMCKLCDLESEDERHIVIDCETLGNFWSHIFVALRKIDGVNFQIQDSLFVCSTEQSDLVNVIIEEAKWQVWKRRCLIRYENMWIDEAQMLGRLKTHLLLRKEVLINTKHKNNEYIEKINLFLGVF